MPESISFGTWLRQQRRALDLTQKAFANRVGCAEITVRRMEADEYKPSKELALVLFEKLGIPEPERPQWVRFARGISNLPIQSIPQPNKPNSNLPVSLTSFIGREKEQQEVVGIIDKHRLITLTGSGGIGKTRFAIKVGEQLLGNYLDGVWLVELASLNDPTLLPQSAATLFGLITQSGISHTDLLVNFLRAKSMLLILDNCEHLRDACAHLADTLLKNCPHLKILVTSREPLEIAGEALYRIPSLRLPDLQYRLDTLRDFESVKLFEERAQLIQFDFSLTLEMLPLLPKSATALTAFPWRLNWRRRESIYCVWSKSPRVWLMHFACSLAAIVPLCLASKPCKPQWIGVMTFCQRRSVFFCVACRSLRADGCWKRRRQCALEMELNQLGFWICSRSW